MTSYEHDIGGKRMLTTDEIGDIEPRLARDDVAAGAWEPNSGHADGSTVANSFIRAARGRISTDM